MTSSLAVAIVRAWVRAYTWGLSEAIAETRRQEIDADLWSFVHDPANGPNRLRLGTNIITRALLGAWDDIAWRAGQAGWHAGHLLRVAVCAASTVAASTFVVAAH